MPSSNQIALQEITQTMIRYMNLDCEVRVTEELQGAENIVLVSLYTDTNARVLIGKDGQNLKALEHVLRMMFFKQGTMPTATVTVDVNDYRKTKSQQAIVLARQVVERVRNTQKAEALLPMSSYERRIVHMELAAHTDIVTESIGEEPQRRVVVKPFSLK